MQTPQSRLHALVSQLSSGAVSRRTFVLRAAALGVSAPVALALSQQVLAQDATPISIVRPSDGTDTQTRGAGGELRILQWQAVSQLSPHTATAGADILGATPVLESLMLYGPEGELLPNLVVSVPSLADDSLAADASSAVFSLLPGVTWSDGEPFTAHDVVFTWQWIMDEANASISLGYWMGIAEMVAVDDLTLQVTYAGPDPTWFLPFTGVELGAIYPKHILETGTIEEFGQQPVGTGPFVVESFTPNDEIVYAANALYREPTKPHFSRIVLKGGGDPASAARAVFQSGEYDFASNLSVEPDVLKSIATGDLANLIVYPTTAIETLFFNFSDPTTEVNGQRSEVNTPHPFLSDPVVRRALTLAIDRETISTNLYLGGDLEPPTANILVGVPELESPNTTIEYDPALAEQLLDEAGWLRDGDVRSKDGVPMRMVYGVPISSLRQKQQLLVSDNLRAIGVDVVLEEIDPAIFFNVVPDNDESITKFYRDMQQAASGAESKFPVGFLQQWYAGEDNWNIPQAENQWYAVNIQRYVNPEFDALYDEVSGEADPERAAELFIEMNDLLVNDYACLVLGNPAEKVGAASWMQAGNFGFGPFTNAYWNIANWRREDA